MLATYLVSVAYIFAENRISGFALGFGGLPWWQYLGSVLLQAALASLWGVALALGPLVVMLLVADLLLWRDRARYRLFFKGAMYSATVYPWLAMAILIVGITIAIRNPNQDGLPALGGWLLASAMTWQYAMIYHAVLGKRFAALLPARPGRKAALSLWVLGVWLFAVYLALFDCYSGLRFATAAWCSPVL